MTNWISFEERFRDKYLCFARECYGDNAYQASENYLSWLYEANPTPGSGWKDFLIGVADDSEVVGCMHKMRLTWCVKGQSISVPAIHNLFVQPTHRTSIDWLRATLAKEEHIFIPGSTGTLSGFYRGLGFEQIPLTWYCKRVQPIASCTRLAMYKIFGWNPAKKSIFLDLHLQKDNTQFCATTAPSDGILTSVASLWNQAAKGQAAPKWTKELLAWRFFHASGPHHVLVYEENTDEIKAFLLFSLGVRKGFNIARILGLHSESSATFSLLLKVANRVIRHCGGHVILSPFADNDLQQQLRQSGWLSRPRPVYSFCYHRSGEPFRDFCLTGAAGDYGFEAIDVSCKHPL